MASRLPPEILGPIFQEIYNSRPNSKPHEQYRNLFSCLMVNRLWCRSVISYIWSSVFTSHSPVRNGAIDKYISCLSPPKLEVLRCAGVQLPAIPSTPPIFNYPVFLRNLRFEIFLRDVFDWCHEHNASQHHDLVVRLLLELFAESGARLETFEMKFVDRNAFPDYCEKLERLGLNFICEDRFKPLFCGVKKLWLGRDAIESCENLESLTFHDCFCVTSELVEPLLLNAWTKLEYVYVTPSFLDSEAHRGQRNCESLERWAKEFSNNGKFWESNSVPLN
ncbi:15927_t:CDS:2 [Acaulospora colombiana]|uniref:15927_t:CDS:1 n=1 Tax=Acaulospora colombiana TaxID=27376 RepID=A0ACA9LKH9_9GLOM|nr:15927_t:CDS:2 [Acaulospora colombiana]